MQTIENRCAVAEREGVVLSVRANDAPAEEIRIIGVSPDESECIERLVDARLLWQAISPTFEDAALTELQVKIELHPRQPDRPRRGPDGFLYTWELPQTNL